MGRLGLRNVVFGGALATCWMLLHVTKYTEKRDGMNEEDKVFARIPSVDARVGNLVQY